MNGIFTRRHVWPLLKSGVSSFIYQQVALLSAQEVATALRPFYFAVHPDLFWQYPKEKEINENSLKLLNSYLETIFDNRPTNKSTTVTFYLRDTKSKADGIEKQSSTPFKIVNIYLQGSDLRTTVHKILSACQLSTDYIDELNIAQSAESSKVSYAQSKIEEVWDDIEFTSFWKYQQTTEVEEKIKNEPEIELRSWLIKNVTVAQDKLRACQPIQEETERLSKELKELLKLSDIIWDCGWGVSHFRGCLLSFRGLAVQHGQDMKILEGRTVIFGKQTGVSLDGHVILSSEDVRHNWLDLILSVRQYDVLMDQVPVAEKSLSEVLRGVTIDHRRFQPTVMIQKYVQQLCKLSSALYKYKWQHGYPESWPRRMEYFQLVVECEAGPLMLSPTGQFIVPASCPAFLLVDFISKNMDEASHRMENYKKMRTQECELYYCCRSNLGLLSLEKDDNITPDLMVQCCERLLANATFWSVYLRDCKLRVSHYYSVLQDGEICIPWDWKQVQMSN